VNDDRAPLDISIPFGAHIPPWPGDVTFECGWTARRENGSSVNLAHMHLSAHSGTHADAPLHVESTWGASETLPLNAFVGDALVVSLPESLQAGRTVDANVIETLVREFQWSPRLLLRTGVTTSARGFPEEWPSVDESAVQWLVSRGLRLLGVDCPSVDARHSTTLPVHHALFASGAYVLENLALDGVAPGPYELSAAPIHVVGTDAAPVRAFLRRPR